MFRILQLENEKVFMIKENQSLENHRCQLLPANLEWNDIRKWIKDKIVNMNVHNAHVAK